MMMSKSLSFTVFFLGLLSIPLSSQQGKILEKREVPFTKEIHQNILTLGKAMPKLVPFMEEVPRKVEAVTVWEITYLSDNLKVRGFLLEPKKEGKFPCIIVNRGGNREFGIWNKEATFLLLAEISSWGYVVAASQYRGCAGGEGREEFGGRDVKDVLALIPLLESREKADMEKMGMIGMSRGGMMTYLALSQTDRLKAAAVVNGITDLFSWEKARPEMGKIFMELIGGNSEGAPEALRARSAIFWPEKLSKKTPLLIVQGAKDERVPPQQALEMASALLKISYPFRLVLLEGGDHNLTDFWPEWLEIIQNWFGKHLQ